MLHRPAATGAAAGARAIAPLVAGLIPFGLTVGARAAEADLAPGLGWATSIVLYGGSGQLALVEVFGSSGSIVAAVAATLAVNLQMLLYGMGMRDEWSGQSARWRAAAAYLLVGPVFAVTAGTPRDPHAGPAQRRAFYLGAGFTLWAAWLTYTGVGFLAGTALSASAAFALATPLVLATMALRAVKDRPGVVALIVGASVAVVLRDAPNDLGFVIAGVVGVVVATLADSRSSGDEQEHQREQEASP